MISYEKITWPVVHEQSPVVCQFLNDKIAIGNVSGDIILFELKDKNSTQIRIQAIHSLSLLSISSPEDGSFLVTTSMDGICAVTNSSDLKLIREIPCKEAVFPRAKVSRNGKVIAIAGNNGILYLEKEGDIQTFQLSHESFIDLDFFGVNDSKLVCITRHIVVIFDVEKLETLNKLEIKGMDSSARNHCVAGSPNEDKYAIGSSNGWVTLYSADESENKLFEIAILTHGKSERVKLIEKMQYTPDGSVLVASTSNGTVVFLNSQTLVVEKSIKDQRSRVFWISISQNYRMVSVADDKTVLVSTLRDN